MPGYSPAAVLVRSPAMQRWKDAPGSKVLVPLHTLEAWMLHMAQPQKYEASLREHARQIAAQLAALETEKVKPEPRPPGWPPVS